MKRTSAIIATLGLTLLLNACGGSGSDTAVPKPTATLGVVGDKAPVNNTFSLKDGAVTTQLTAAQSTSPRQADLEYRWELIARPPLSQAKISAVNTAVIDFTADLPGDYVVSLIVNDGTSNSAASRMTFTATSPVPVAVTEAIHSVSLGIDSLGLSGDNSTLPTGQTGQLQYQWTLNEKPKDSAASLLNADQSQATLQLDIAGDYKLQLVVIYDGISSTPNDVVVTVSSGNSAPVAKADDLTIELGQQVVLDGSASIDPDGEQLQYRWQWDSTPVKPKGAPVPDLLGKDSATLRFTPQAVGTYHLTFFVYDGVWKSAEKDVVVTVVNPTDATTNTPPIGEIVATGYWPSYSIGEQEVGLRANFVFTGYDREGQPLQITSAKLIEKPSGSIAELVDNKYNQFGKKIQKLDVVGTYRVRMTISDGVNELIKEATMVAKIGNVNGQPSTRGVTAQAKSVLVGDALIFDASSKDPNKDQMTFHWTLVDKPDGSNAVIEAVIEPESKEYRRAKVITDMPGSYTARLIVSDDRGLYAKSYAQDDGMAKLSNTAPVIRSVVWARNWSRMAPGESYYQILPCMSLLHRPVIVDADGDKIYPHEKLISTPEGGAFTSKPSSEDCPDSRGQVFSKPGTYTFRYYASDGIDEAVEYDFVVKVDSFEEATGVRLRSINSDNESLWRPLPYENIPPFANDFYASSHPYLDAGAIEWSLSAEGADYTIENVQVRHINGGLTDLTPWFEGLSEGLVIKQGESLDFKTWLPAVTCIRNNEKSEGFHLSFRIKEIPEITFTYETWRTANDRSSSSDWSQCDAG